jgi:hypothetical protein
MRETMAQKVIDEMRIKGFRLVGQTSGQFSFRKGSNLSQALECLGLTEYEVKVRTGARAGKNATEGYQLLIFVKEE